MPGENDTNLAEEALPILVYVSHGDANEIGDSGSGPGPQDSRSGSEISASKLPATGRGRGSTSSVIGVLGIGKRSSILHLPPSVQLLHCIKQYDADEKGGVSHMVDGFRVAAQIKEAYPQNYEILSKVPLEFADVGKDFKKFHKIHLSPAFVHTSNGQLTRIVYSNQQLSSCLPIPISQVKPLYQSLKLFTNLCYNPKNLMKFKLNEGDILIFDNWRLLHGREGFDASKGDRHVEGCYVDWNEIYSSIRVLEAEIRSSS